MAPPCSGTCSSPSCSPPAARRHPSSKTSGWGTARLSVLLRWSRPETQRGFAAPSPFPSNRCDKARSPCSPRAWPHSSRRWWRRRYWQMLLRSAYVLLDWIWKLPAPVQPSYTPNVALQPGSSPLLEKAFARPFPFFSARNGDAGLFRLKPAANRRVLALSSSRPCWSWLGYRSRARFQRLS